MPKLLRPLLSLLLLLLLATAAAPDAGWAAEVSDAAAQHPEPAEAMKLVSLPKGLELRLWAQEPLLTNPVAFSIDRRGRVYVVETGRYHTGALDIRRRLQWLAERVRKTAPPERLARIGEEMHDAELAARTIDDRLRFNRAYTEAADMRRFAETLALVEDTNGDGVADRREVFAGGFNHELDGIAAGVLPFGDQVFFTNIPHLWSLRDRDGDGKAEERRSLGYGFGVRYAFTGHDLHGPRMGPDGRLYFSIGDRGAHVRTADGRTVSAPDTGAVFRCNPDGSELELFAWGLRNPHDLVFDKHGDLFSGDNNSDGGDRARWVHIVEGSDTGWRYHYQLIEGPVARGPWNLEKMWHKQHAGQPAHVIPPVELLGNGPAGVAYHPGTGLGAKRWADRFFMIDFKGQTAMSGIWSFTLREKGATYEMVAPEKTLWGALVTDAEFGLDGSLYLLDWVQGWAKPGKGRIYRVVDPAAVNDPEVAATRELLADGMEGRSDADLGRLLAHADIRVRQEAQLALASCRAAGTLQEITAKSPDRLARLHGIWGLGQILRADARVGRGPDQAVAAALDVLLADADAEVRAQAASVLGDARVVAALPKLRERTTDPNARVRFFATMALGKLGRAEAIPAVTAVLRANADEDVYLRHAAVFALERLAPTARALDPVARDASRSVRLGALLAMRRLRLHEVAGFLSDKDPGLLAEAARAINDDEIVRANGALAALAEKDDLKLDGPTALRVVNANFRAGDAEAAGRVARLVLRADLPADVRAEAALALGDWPAPRNRDRVTGSWRPHLTARDPEIAAGALDPLFATIAARAPASVLVPATTTAARLKLPSASGVLTPLVERRQGAGAVRAEAVKALAALGTPPPALLAIARNALKDPEPAVRIEALRIQTAIAPAEARRVLPTVMARGTVAERQNALVLGGKLAPADTEALLAGWIEDLVRGRFPSEVTLELLETAAAKGTPALKEKLAKFEASRPKDDLGPYREALYGGNPDEGRRLFRKADTGCLRCHKAEDDTGGEAGPGLDGIAKKHKRDYLLASIVAPNAHFAPGFESLILTLKDGTITGGTARKETPTQITLVTPENTTVVVKKADVKKRERGASGMPEGFGALLTKRELRDIVEFLATLK